MELKELIEQLRKQFGKLDSQELQIINYFKDYDKSVEYIRKYRDEKDRYKRFEKQICYEKKIDKFNKKVIRGDEI